MENNAATEIQATNFFSADDHFVPLPNPDDDEWGTSGDMLEDEGDTSPTGNFTEMYEGCSEAFPGGEERTKCSSSRTSAVGIQRNLKCFIS